MKNENLEEIASAYICVVNAHVRHAHQLTSYAKLICIELIALANDNQVIESSEEIAQLVNLPLALVEESLDLLEHYNFISLSYEEDNRVITLEEICR